MLVHHADAAGHSLRRGGKAHLFPTDADRSRCRLLHTVEHTHQRCFSGTVLAYKGMDLPFAQRKTDVPVGREFAVFLRNLFHLQQHFPHSLPSVSDMIIAAKPAA
ncbi:hypothetical protein D1872_288730 [compost metagenome]